MQNTPIATLAATSLTDTAAHALPSSSTTFGCYVAAPLANTQPIYIGDASVTTSTGVELQPGDREFFPVSDPSRLYAITASGTQSVRVFAI